jgi:hypothetical protein
MGTGGVAARLTVIEPAGPVVGRPQIRDARGGPVAGKPNKGVDPGWPQVAEDEHAVSELVSDRQGALSPFGEVEFPLPGDKIPYIHPVTVINR